MKWSRRFNDPIELPDGRTIKTLKEAAAYGLKLPKDMAASEPWQTAADVLHKAAGHGGPFLFIARISFAKAVFGGSAGQFQQSNTRARDV